MLQSMGSQRVGHDLPIEKQQRSCRMFLRARALRTKQSLKPLWSVCVCWEKNVRMGGDREVEEGASSLDSLEVKLPSLLSQAQAGLE